MKKVTIKLTKRQRDEIESLRKGKSGGFTILGEALFDVNKSVNGTANFYCLTWEQSKVIHRAIQRAKKMDSK